ncbi:MAG: hypothetical protein ACRBN8_26195 [Nannocystales bacterium]
MRRWVLRLGLLGGLAPALAACTSSSGVFTCAADTDCTGEGVGTCQSNGFCAFPDAMCESGARYGELAGGGFANMCVPQGGPDDTDTSAAATGTTTSTASTATTLSTDATSETGASSSSASSSETGDPAESSTTGPTPECEVLPMDGFDDKELWPDWETEGPGTVELSGGIVELRPTMEAGDQPTWIRRPTPVRFQGGWFHVALYDVPSASGLQAIISLTREGGVDSYDIVVDEAAEQVHARSWHAGGFTDLTTVPFDKFDTPWVGLREAEGRIIFERGESEDTLVPFFDVEADISDWDSTLYIGADNFVDLMAPLTVDIEHASACAQPR